MNKRLTQFGFMLLTSLVGIFIWSGVKLKERQPVWEPRPLKVAIVDGKQGNNKETAILFGELYILQKWMEEVGGVIGYTQVRENSVHYPIHRIKIEKVEDLKSLDHRNYEYPAYPEPQFFYEQDSRDSYDWIYTLSETMNDMLSLSQAMMNGELLPQRDIMGTIHRAIAFLCEEEVSIISGKYLILYLDLEKEEAQREEILEGLPCHMKVLAISSTSKVPLLEAWNVEYLSFESFSSALAYIIEKERYHPYQ